MRLKTLLVAFVGMPIVHFSGAFGPLIAQPAGPAGGAEQGAARADLVAQRAGSSDKRGKDVIKVGPNVHVSKPNASRPHAEVFLAADPNDPTRLLAGSMIDFPSGPDGTGRSIVYSSFDGGATWEATLETPANEFFGFPYTAYGPDGSAYFVTRDENRRENLVYRSRDGGKRWELTTRIAAKENLMGAHLTIDCTGGRYGGRIYCTAQGHRRGIGGGSADTLALLYSTDEATTFERPDYVVCIKPNWMDTLGNAVVLSDGTLALLYHRNTIPFAEEMARPPYPHAREATLGVVFSDDGGRSFSDRRSFISEWKRTIRSGMCTMAVDASAGPFKDRLYAVWSNKGPDGHRVLFAYSKDKGTTWSKAVLISEKVNGIDLPAAYDAMVPTVAANRHGIIGVSWYDTSGLPADTLHWNGLAEGILGWNVRFRASVDGGETWLPSVQVTTAPSVFTEEMRRNANKFEQGVYLKVGETAGLTADTAGGFHALWMDSRTGVRQVWTASIDVRPAK